MSKKKVFPFMLSAQPALPMSGAIFFSDPISPDDSMVLGGPWSIEFTEIDTVVGGPPLYTLEVRNDPDSDWADYSPTTTDVPITTPLEDDHFAFFNMRLKVDPNGTTEGSGKVGLFVKGK